MIDFIMLTVIGVVVGNILFHSLSVIIDLFFVDSTKCKNINDYPIIPSENKNDFPN